ncbi:MAG: S-methyl-5'-thioadenosine phosphorylase [Anaerohalosphaeraceae bacterium]|nr:S-methyl-5'-thioadenosine phosphorylase [Anaerohalosphaeraceae bacterium]
MGQIVGIIGGSGIGDEIENMLKSAKKVKVETPFGPPSGEILMGCFGSKTIAFINRHGTGHKFSPSTVPYAANIYALKKIGVTTVISSCACGSLQEEIRPKELIVVDQIIDKTVKRQNTFFDEVGAAHCELAQPYCGRLRKAILDVADKVQMKVHHAGTYVCMEGPAFSTRAESLMHKSWGADLIGMTAMPEAKLAREAQMCFALVAMASDYDCWRDVQKSKDKHQLLAEIIGNLNAATTNAISLIKTVLETDGLLCSDDCQCRKSLDLALWTKLEIIDPKFNEMLDILRK